MSHGPEHDSVKIRRWNHHGHDRLYATRAGVELGWWDLLTDQGHPSRPEHWPALHAAATRSGLRRAKPAHPPQQRLPQPQPQPQPQRLVRPEWDLAQHQPGQSVLAQAREFEARRRAIAWVPRPPRRSLRVWLTSSREERARFHAGLEEWRRIQHVQVDHDRQLQAAARPWALGAQGEGLVAREIDSLIRADPRWRVLHAVPVGVAGADIDHVLIGPGGVFTLNAKHVAGRSIWVAGTTFMVGRTSHSYIRNSEFEARRASKFLTAACGFPISVRGMIVPVNAHNITIREPPRHVDVINRQRLVWWLRRYPDQIPMPVVDQIFAAARRSTTWQ